MLTAVHLTHRESLAQLVEAGKKVVDNPTHLADFGAALTSADSQHLQAVLECKDVRMSTLDIVKSRLVSECVELHTASFQ